MIPGAVYQSTPPPAYLERRREIDTNATDFERYLFYLEGVVSASAELVRLKAEGKTVLLDRYWMTTVAYRRANGVPADRAHFGDIIEPDVVVYLEVSPEVRQQRMMLRKLSVGDKRDLSVMPAVLQEYEQLLLGVKNLIRIDTSLLTQDQVASLVLRELAPILK